MAESHKLFEEAEATQATNQPDYPMLYSVRGYYYCDLLLAAGERAAWRAWSAGVSPLERPPTESATENEVRGSGATAALAAVESRTRQTLEWVTRHRLGFLSIVSTSSR
jgi:hypothetical protein